MTTLALAMLLAGGCTPDQGINKLEPKLTFSPVELNYGEVVVDYPTTATLEIINTGRVPLNVSNVYLSESTGDIFLFESEEMRITEDERQELVVTFTPSTFLDYEDALILESNDPDLPLAYIPITGTGVDAPTPDNAIDPLTLDFGEVEPLSVATLWFTIVNEGDGELRITGTSQEGSGNFQVVTDPEGATLAPLGADVQTIVVIYTPQALEGDSGTFTIQSDDPDEPEIVVHFLGNGGGDFEYPVAVIDGPANAAPLDYLTLDGSDSYDPQGFAITDYEWTLSSTPSGSASELSSDVSDSTSFFLDIAGHYEVQLKVTNEIGLSSAPEKYQVDAIPDDRVHVELLWDTPNTDLDLHMFSGPGVSFFNIPDDCTWCNPNPNWGATLDSNDNPLLALDDISGFGPENININEPASGEYPVRVHFFEDNGGGATTATVRFYIDGILGDSYSRVLQRNEVWDVATVRWPDGLVVEENADPYEAPRRGCSQNAR
ncbi:MAG: choice-of-anchor D domain-containing protein [Myxococcota bacterium]|nr:choice-of-anchor D domain-containing protein [Myxococcota bacterium]